MSVVDEIKDRLDIVELIGELVPWQKAGRNYKALCPFHSEKTPSFVVFPDSQNWHCFGACSTGGDIFGFIMRRENLDFGGALRFLADKAGIPLTPLDDEEQRQKEERDRLRAVNAATAQFYHHLLMDSPQAEVARRYLERRGVTPETMALFQLGYAPNDWHLLEHHLRRDFALEDAFTAGVLSKNERGNIYDRFRHRIMVPSRDALGHVTGFGGRVLDDSEPKYLNSPQTPLFDKSSVLYGIDLARASIRESGTAIIVEGYMDVIIPHQCGITNVVACMGTALTEAQLNILKRMTKVLILALDPDAAGLRAVEQGIETARKSLEHRVVPVLTGTGLIRYEEQLDAEIRVLMLPDGLDPDELVLRDRARWDRLVATALPVGDFFFQLVEREVDLSTAKGKRQAAERLLPLIAAMDNVVERTHHLQRLARMVHVDERQLLPQVEKLRGGRPADTSGTRTSRPGRAPTAMPPQGASAVGLEERCLSLLLYSPDLLSHVREVTGLSIDAFRDVRNREAYRVLLSFTEANPDLDPLAFREGLDSALRGHVESLLHKLELGPPLSPEMVRDDLIKSAARLQKNHLSALIAELQFLQRDAQEQGSAERLRELSALTEKLRRDYLRVDQQYYAATLMGKSRKSSHL